ncbi:MAG: 2-oxo acid dehydrogenase subunit E2 [Alphaproteobacteria bacterium]|nr:2-oxo acid dehydrogenase subunit E2 [Alphaproteobacteria bacterium]
MSDTVIMPQLGETVAEGKILTWFKAVGDNVKTGDKLFEVETDKVTVEVEAIAAGKLSEIRVGEGQTAKVGAVVAVLGGTDGTAAAAAPAKPAPALSAFAEVKTPTAQFGRAKTADGIAISPLARRSIVEQGASIEAVTAYAKSKNLRRVSESDVKAALARASTGAASAPTPAPGPSAPSGGVPLSSIRQKTADRLVENWRTIPHVFQAVEIDFTNVEAYRSRHKQSFKAATGFALTYLPFIARATCLALKAFPNINARFDGTTLQPSAAVHLGIAVDLDHKGLVVPVIRDAEDLTVAGLAKAMGRMIAKARDGKLTADDLSGGTYSITNNGAFGTLFTSPIINAPQVAILSADAIRMRPAVVETAEGHFIAPRLMGVLGQSFDHRAFDGAYSAAFLSRLKQIIETHDWSTDIAE